MITSEQELLLVEQYAMPLCMSRRGNDHKVRAGWHGLGTVEDNFGIWLGSKFGAVDDALGHEVPGIFSRIGDVILMREENLCYPTHGLESPHEIGQEFWRIDEPVAVGMLHEITVATVRLGRIEAAVKHTVVEAEGKVRPHFVGIVAVHRTDRPGGAGQ